MRPMSDSFRAEVLQDRCDKLQAEVERLQGALEEIDGHGVDLGAARQASEEYQAGYTYGVGSQRSIAHKALAKGGEA